MKELARTAVPTRSEPGAVPSTKKAFVAIPRIGLTCLFPSTRFVLPVVALLGLHAEKTCSRLWHFRRLQGEDRFDDTWVTSESVCYGDNPDDIQPFSNLFKSQQPARIAEDEGTTAASRSSSATRTRGRGSGDGRAGGARGFGTRRDGGVDVRTGSVAPPKEYYTNTELYQLLKPDGEAMPYAYDNFEWPHCDVSRRVPGSF